MSNGLQMKYFVIKPKGSDQYAIASRKALRAYAQIIEPVNAELARDLYSWADAEMALASTAVDGKDER